MERERGGVSPAKSVAHPPRRTVHDHEHLPDETFWQVGTTSPPWHLCDEHAGNIHEYRDRLKANLARAEGLLTSLDSLADDLRDSETITMAGELRELMLEMRVSIEAKLRRLISRASRLSPRGGRSTLRGLRAGWSVT